MKTPLIGPLTLLAFRLRAARVGKRTPVVVRAALIHCFALDCPVAHVDLAVFHQVDVQNAVHVHHVGEVVGERVTEDVRIHDESVVLKLDYLARVELEYLRGGLGYFLEDPVAVEHVVEHRNVRGVRLERACVEDRLNHSVFDHRVVPYYCQDIAHIFQLAVRLEYSGVVEYILFEN